MSDGSMTIDAAIVSAGAPSRALQAHGSRRTSSAYALVTPAVTLMLAMLLGPLAGVIALSFTDYQLGAPRFSWRTAILGISDRPRPEATRA